MSTAPLRPLVKWAQRKEKVYVSVDIPGQDCNNLKVNYDKDQEIDISAEANGKQYACKLALSNKIIPKESSHRVGRNIEIQLKKDGEEWWKTLVSTGKDKLIQCDWDKWVDEDEADEPEPSDWSNGMGGMDFGGMGGMGGMGMPGMEGMGGMGGMGGMDFSNLGADMGDMGDLDEDDMSDLDDENDEAAKDAEPSKGADAPAEEAETTGSAAATAE